MCHSQLLCSTIRHTALPPRRGTTRPAFVVVPPRCISRHSAGLSGKWPVNWIHDWWSQSVWGGSAEVCGLIVANWWRPLEPLVDDFLADDWTVDWRANRLQNTYPDDGRYCLVQGGYSKWEVVSNGKASMLSRGTVSIDFVICSRLSMATGIPTPMLALVTNTVVAHFLYHDVKSNIMDVKFNIMNSHN